MVTKPQARQLLARAVLTDTRIPSEMDVIIREADSDGSDATKTLPLLLVVFDSGDRFAGVNTDLVGHELNENDERVAEIYERQWEAEARIEVWTAEGSSYEADELGSKVHDVLYGYDTKTSDDPFLDASENEVESLWHFHINSGRRVDDLIQTPTVRRWRIEADVYGSHKYKGSTQEPIQSVDLPEF